MRKFNHHSTCRMKPKRYRNLFKNKIEKINYKGSIFFRAPVFILLELLKHDAALADLKRKLKFSDYTFISTELACREKNLIEICGFEKTSDGKKRSRILKLTDTGREVVMRCKKIINILEEAQDA